ncbi:MAG: CHASE3 domain-containing protein [Hyphomicrobiaceae bacterium]|nr:CHASE3 domain-containing protein [Hyphomicrobiaceae bacterium]
MTAIRDLSVWLGGRPSVEAPSKGARRLIRVTYVLSGVALVLLVALFATSFWLFERNQQATVSLLQAREQRGALFRLMLSVQAAESGQRGYLLTGNTSYLDPYRSALEHVNDRLQAVHRLYASEEVARSGLDDLITQKLAELSSTIALCDAGNRAEAMAVVLDGHGQRTMDRLRDQVEAMVATADEDISNSVRTQTAVAQSTRLFTAVSAALILGAAVGAVLMILRYLRELIATRSALEVANVSLEDRVKERTSDLYRANEEIQRFAYIVSHDLRSPLVNIMGFTSELETSLADLASLSADPGLLKLEAGSDGKRAIDKDIPEAIDFIRRSTIKMDGLIKAILQLSREGQRVLVPQRIDLGELLDSISAGVQHRLNETDGEIVIRRPLGVIEADRLALEQIFGNLIDNAIKYRRPSVPPRIVVREEAARFGEVTIAVEDNGRGIAREDLERVFDLFRRAGAQDQAGEGIGLAHVRSLARRLGGDVSVTSEVGAGTVFRVRLSRRVRPERKDEPR